MLSIILSVVLPITLNLLWKIVDIARLCECIIPLKVQISFALGLGLIPSSLETVFRLNPVAIDLTNAIDIGAGSGCESAAVARRCTTFADPRKDHIPSQAPKEDKAASHGRHDDSGKEYEKSQTNAEVGEKNGGKEGHYDGRNEYGKGEEREQKKWEASKGDIDEKEGLTC